MTIVESPKDDIELALLILAEQVGSQRFPVPWTVRLAEKVIQQDTLLRKLINPVKDDDAHRNTGYRAYHLLPPPCFSDAKCCLHCLHSERRGIYSHFLNCKKYKILCEDTTICKECVDTYEEDE